MFYVQLFHERGPYHIETSKLMDQFLLKGTFLHSHLGGEVGLSKSRQLDQEEGVAYNLNFRIYVFKIQCLLYKLLALFTRLILILIKTPNLLEIVSLKNYFLYSFGLLLNQIVEYKTLNAREREGVSPKSNKSKQQGRGSPNFGYFVIT